MTAAPSSPTQDVRGRIWRAGDRIVDGLAEGMIVYFDLNRNTAWVRFDDSTERGVPLYRVEGCI